MGRSVTRDTVLAATPSPPPTPPTSGRGTLPIHAVLPDLLAALREGSNAVLVAPPGAGKTTAVAPALLDQPWCDGEILLLSPRRLAARAAAERMAELAGERVGGTDRLRDPARQQALGGDAHPRPYRGHFPQPHPGRSRACGRLGGPVRRGPRAQPRQRFRARARARRAGGFATRPAADRDVGDARRDALREADGRRAVDRERGPQPSDRPAPSRPCRREEDRGRDGRRDPARARRDRGQPARLPARRRRDRAHRRTARPAARRCRSPPPARHARSGAAARRDRRRAARTAQARARHLDRRDQPDPGRRPRRDRQRACAPPALRPRGRTDPAGHRAREPGVGHAARGPRRAARRRASSTGCGRRPRPRACRASTRPKSSRPTSAR